MHLSTDGSIPLSRALIGALMLTGFLLMGNLYYTQPIIEDIAPSLGLADQSAGILLTAVQSGYMAGTLLIAPLADVIENRRLILATILAAGAALLCASLSPNAALFCLSAFVFGFCSVAGQISIVFGVGLAAPDRKGRVLTAISSGLFAGVVVARPYSAMLASLLGWRAVYFAGAAFMLALAAVLTRLLPRVAVPAQPFSYKIMFGSMANFLTASPLLRRLLGISTLTFTLLNVFWATAPLYLIRELGYAQHDVALYTFLCAATPVLIITSGRLLDRGLGSRLAIAGSLAALLAWILTGSVAATGAFVAAALLIDPLSSLTLVATQKAVLQIAPNVRSRLNSLNVSVNFIGAAIGSALGPFVYALGGWTALAAAGSILVAADLALIIASRRDF